MHRCIDCLDTAQLLLLSGTYPCPACQPAFYRSDFIQVHSAQKVRSNDWSLESFKKYILNRLSSILGQTVPTYCLFEKEKEFVGVQFNETEIHRWMYVVRKDAKGWIKK